VLVETLNTAQSNGHPPGKPGKLWEFDIGQGKLREIMCCLCCAVAFLFLGTPVSDL